MCSLKQTSLESSFMYSIFWDDGQFGKSVFDRLSEGYYGLHYPNSSSLAPITCLEGRSFYRHNPTSENLTMKGSASQTLTLEGDAQPCPRPCCDGGFDLQSPQDPQTPLGHYPETFFQPHNQAYNFTPCYASLERSQPIPSIVSTDYSHGYVPEANMPFSFQHHSPTVPMSPISDVTDAGTQSVVAPHSPIIVQSPTLETVGAPSASSDATVRVEQPRVVGSMANTLVAISLRKKGPKYFCDVPGCRSQGFTQKHNLEYHKRSHRNERPFKCDYCLRSFGARCDLTRHRKRRTCHHLR
ncbi:hypothetical protein PM082_005060 [Marasmius tenuissimus]|nr:hypothetical protein PM082_005060 [Marasmius tenuissimus]